MKNILKYLNLNAVCILMCLSVHQCKQYPENDKIYFSTVNSRLLGTKWHINRILINDIDSTSATISKFYNDLPQNVFLVFARESQDSYSYSITYPGQNLAFRSAFSFSNHKENIKSSWFALTNNIMITDFRIRKLTKNELIIYSENGDKNYRISFNAKH